MTLKTILRQTGLVVGPAMLMGCGDPSPPPQTAQIDEAVQKQQLSVMKAEMDRDNAIAYQYQIARARAEAAKAAAERQDALEDHQRARKEYVEDVNREQRGQERLMRIFVSKW